MPDKASNGIYFGNAVSCNATKFHEDCILQTLDRPIKYDDDIIVYDSESFSKSVDDWNGIPVFFSRIKHPDVKIVSDDPEKAAEEIEGRVVGHVREPRIVTKGHARLMGTLVINDDEAEELWKNGKLSLSTGFEAGKPGLKKNSDGLLHLSGTVVPNHVLIFPESIGGMMPRDLGTLVNTEQNMSNEPQRQTFSEKLKAFLKKELPPEMLDESHTPSSVDNTTKEPKQESTTMATDPTTQEYPELMKAMNDTITAKNARIAELESLQLKNADAETEDLRAEITRLEGEKAALEEENAKLKKELDEIKSAETERAIDEMMNAVPEGMKATQEQRDKLREQFKTDPLGAASAIVNAVSGVRGGETRKAGTPFTNTDGGNITRTNADPSNWNFPAGGK